MYINIIKYTTYIEYILTYSKYIIKSRFVYIKYILNVYKNIIKYTTYIKYILTYINIY